MKINKFYSLIMMLFLFFTPACKKNENKNMNNSPQAHELLAPDEAVKGESLYQLKTSFTDQEGKSVLLDVYEGHPVVLSMFYATCPYSCPVLIDQLKRLEKKMDDKTRAQVRFILISFDPESDTVPVLKQVLGKHGLDGTRWKILRGDESQVREIAALVGVKFRKLQGGDINHTALITFLDPKGLIDSQYEMGKFSAEEAAHYLHEMLEGKKESAEKKSKD